MAEKVELVEIVHLPESMECPLCLEAFKAPTLLACGHTFCKLCLNQYDEQHRGQDFMECPVCKKRTKLEKNRVAGLVPNFSVKGLEEELHAHLRVNGKSSEYCSLHSKVYKDILCEICKEFICLTCLFDKHQDHRFKKKEELKPYLKKKRKSICQKSEEKKAQIKKSITNAEQYRTVMHSHLANLDKEIKNSFSEKLEILRGHCERLTEEVDNIRNNSDKVLKEFIARQRQTLQSIDMKSSLMGQEGIASTSTCTLSDSEAMKALYIGFRDLENELERDLNETSIAHAKQEVESTQFYPSDENDLDLGNCLNQQARESESNFKHAMTDPGSMRETTMSGLWTVTDRFMRN